jgi:hypothetical protein
VSGRRGSRSAAIRAALLAFALVAGCGASAAEPAPSVTRTFRMGF